MDKTYHQAVHDFLAHPHTCPMYSANGKLYCCREQMENWQELVAQHDEYADTLEDEEE